MTRRRFTQITDAPSSPTVEHYWGLPPEPTGGQDTRTPMPVARLLIIFEDPDGALLFRYDENGEFAGDTWHRDVAEASEQAKFEFAGLVREWQDIPEQVEDPVAFALARLRRI